MAVDVKQAKPPTPAQIAEREAAAAARLLVLGLRPGDEIRFRKIGAAQAWIEGKPLDLNSDGSVSCLAGGMLRAIRPDRIEVKMRGPRGGTNWVPLVPEDTIP